MGTWNAKTLKSFEETKILTLQPSKDVKFVEHWEIIDSIQQLLSGDSGFMILGYVDDKSIRLQQASYGNIDKFFDYFDDSQVQYAILRFPEASRVDLSREEGKLSNRDVFISWLGCSVKRLEKGKKQTHLGYVKSIFSISFSELSFLSRKSFTIDIIRNAVAQGLTSHLYE